MLCRNLREHLQQFLEQVPTPEVIDDELVLDERAVGDLALAGLGLSQPALGQEAAGDRAVAQQCDVVRAAILDHAGGRTIVDEGVLELVRHHRYARGHDLIEARLVEIRYADVRDLAGAPQALELECRFDIARHFVIPPVELHEVEALHP